MGEKGRNPTFTDDPPHAAPAPESLPDLALDFEATKRIVSVHRVALHDGIESILQRHGELTCAACGVVCDAVERVFLDYTVAILKDAADSIHCSDSESVLETVADRVSTSIVKWILPEETVWESEHALRFDTLKPSGEWERQLDVVYGWYAQEHPPKMGNAGATVFTFDYVFRHRFAVHRHKFENRLRAAIRRAMSQIEAHVRVRLPMRTYAMSTHQTPERRKAPGFPPDVDDHRKVCAAVQACGQRWKVEPAALCEQLAQRGAAVPTLNGSKFDDWEEVAELVGKHPDTRRAFVKYVQYRLKRQARDK